MGLEWAPPTLDPPHLSPEGPVDRSLVFPNFLALWLLFPPLKLDKLKWACQDTRPQTFPLTCASTLGYY